MENLRELRETYLQKPLPNNQEAEKIILGAILLDQNLITQCLNEKLKPEDFYSPRHKQIFQAMLNLFEKSENINPVLIGEEIKKDGSSVESIGGIASVTDLTRGLPHFSDIFDYIRVVKEKSIARNITKVCSEIISETLEEETPVLDTLEKAEQMIFDLRPTDKAKGFARAGDEVKKTALKVVEISKKAQNGSALLGLSTGFTDLNEKLAGLQAPDLIVIAARPGMGKSGLMLNLALNSTDDDKDAVIAIFSLEMSKEQLSMRLTSQRAKVDSHRYRTGYLTQDEWKKIGIATQEIDEKRIFIDDSPGQTALEIRAKARRLLTEQKRLDLIIIDHLKLMRDSGKFNERRLALGEITKSLKATAKLLGIPIVLLTQLTKACELRNPPKPMMSDVGESGEIIEDADVVLLIYREDYYHKTEENMGIAEIGIAKNRHGATGTVKLAWLEAFTTFENFYQ